ncbi:MAG: YdcF family protein [Gammaproteobacteria bacterium]|nr:YdcF family protein [Gammaproteobacteria bacterium]
MEIDLIYIIKAFLLPPALLLILFAIAGALQYLRDPKAKPLFIASFVLFYLFSCPLIAHLLMSILEPYPVLSQQAIQKNDRDIIVVLGGGKNRSRDFGGEYTVTPNALLRLRYAAWLHKQTGLPVIVTGGAVEEDTPPEAEIMSAVLQNDYGVKPVYQETRSRNTAQNAAFSVKLMQQLDKHKAFLVTQAWHMPRAMLVFERQGADVIPAPTAFKTENFDWSWKMLMPDATAFRDTTYALHELIGYLWYQLRY